MRMFIIALACAFSNVVHAADQHYSAADTAKTVIAENLMTKTVPALSLPPTSFSIRQSLFGDIKMIETISSLRAKTSPELQLESRFSIINVSTYQSDRNLQEKWRFTDDIVFADHHQAHRDLFD